MDLVSKEYLFQGWECEWLMGSVSTEYLFQGWESKEYLFQGLESMLGLELKTGLVAPEYL